MKKRTKLISLTLSLLMVSVFMLSPVSVFALEWRDYRSQYQMPPERISERLMDEADILSPSEETQLKQKLDALNAEYHYDVVIVTVSSLEGYTATEFADDCYDYSGFSKNGILFLISLEGRDWAMSTSGSAIQAFTDDNLDAVFNSVKKDLGNDDWYGAFDEFISQCDKYIKYYTENTTAYSVQNDKSKIIPRIILLSLLVGIAAGVTVAVIRMSANNRKMLGNEVGYSSVSYIDGNIEMIDQYDRFLRNEHSERFVNTESSSSSGGGSSTHIGSSGMSHGGSSGKF